MSASIALAPKRNRFLSSQEFPSSSFINASQSIACLALRMPPAALNPTANPVRSAYSRMARTMARLTGSVAFTASLPVEVLMKSAPAIIATIAARVLEGGDFVVERLPLVSKNVGTSDDYVNLLRSGFDRAPDFGDALAER